VAVNGTTVTLLVDNKQVFTHTFQPRVIDGYVYGLNYGYVGVGSDNSRGSYDNIRAQILPPQLTFDNTENFSDGVADLFTAGTTGVWGVTGQGQSQRYTVTPSGSAAMSLLDLGPDHLNHGSYLEFSTKLNTQGRAGIVFDRYGDESFKWAAIDAAADRLIVGHYTKKGGWVEDAFMNVAINAGQDYTLGVSLKGTTVNATLSGANGGNAIAMVGQVFNASTVDGNFGLMAVSGQSSFDDVRVKTDDGAFVSGQGGNLLASEPVLMTESASTLTQTELEAAAARAMSTWTETLGDGDPRLAGLGNVRITIGDLAGDMLGYAEGRRIWIDRNAAGYGWSSQGGTMDLVTVVTHELGHVLSFDHESDHDVMAGRLEAGVSRLLEAAGFGVDPDAPISDAALMQLARKAIELKFDLDAGTSGAHGTIDWQADAGSSWSADYSPYTAPKDGKAAKSNFSDYLVKLAVGEYDSLGKALFGAKKKGR